ncbi:MAG: hypothetical protein P8R54_31810 [Myxococcota bacterium]|nr:hypothetical protein [Myxococcota bacterium]
MDTITELMRSGGPFMWALLGLLLFAIPLTMILCGIAAAKIRIPLIAWLLFPLLLVMLGVAGTWQGMVQVLATLGYAPLDMRAQLASAGVSLALLSAACGLIMAAGALLLGAWGAAVGAYRGASKSRSGAVLAGTGGLLALLGGLGIVLLSTALGTPLYASGAALALGTPALVLSSIQHGTSAADQARQSENRLSAVVCVLGAVLCTALVSVLGDTMALHKALSYASDEVQIHLMRAAVSGRDTALLLGPVAVATAALSGALVCALGARHTPVGRILASAALVGMGLALSGGVTAAIAQQYSQLAGLWGAYTLEGVAAVVQDLPGEPSTGTQPASNPTHVLLYKDRWIQRQPDGRTESLSLPLPEASAPLLVISGGQPARLISTADWGSGVTPLSILLAPAQPPDASESRWLAAQGLQTVSLEWYPQQRPETPDDALLFVLSDTSGITLHRPGHAPLAGLPDASQALTSQLTADPLLHSVVLVPGEDWTVQDVVTLCADVASARAEAPARCGLMRAHNLSAPSADNTDGADATE